MLVFIGDMQPLGAAWTAFNLLLIMFHMNSTRKINQIETRTRSHGLRKLIYMVSLVSSIVLLGGFADVFESVRWASQSRSEIVTPAIVPGPLFDQRAHWTDPLKVWPKAPKMTDEEMVKSLSKDDILNDKLDRLTGDFKVPPELRDRMSFWFDIYTRFGEYEHVIHHTRFPWIIYKVVDGRDIVAQSKGPLWLRRQRVIDLAAAERKKIRKALAKLASRKSYSKLTPLEKELADILKSVPGPRKKVYKLAASSIRSQLGQKDFFVAGLRRSTKYLPLMEAEFTKMNLPLELTRMPFVESSFNENAESKVGASGIWQIMPRTGKAYSLVNENIDERNSPMKATLVAGQMLKKYKRALKQWPLVITSYNHGIGNIRKAIRAAGSEDIATIIERYHRGEFKFASSNFYTGFLAALYAEKYNDALFQGVVREPLIDFVEIQLQQATRVKTLLKASGLSNEELFHYNRDLKVALKNNALLPKGFRIHLPPGQAETLIAKISKLIKIRAPQVPS